MFSPSTHKPPGPATTLNIPRREDDTAGLVVPNTETNRLLRLYTQNTHPSEAQHTWGKLEEEADALRGNKKSPDIAAPFILRQFLRTPKTHQHQLLTHFNSKVAAGDAKREGLGEKLYDSCTNMCLPHVGVETSHKVCMSECERQNPSNPRRFHGGKRRHSTRNTRKKHTRRKATRRRKNKNKKKRQHKKTRK